MSKEHTMNRKEFVVKSTAGLVGLGITGCTSPAVVKKTYRGRTIEYRTLGKTGLKVTAVGFGASRTDVPSLVKHVIDTGVNFIDTGRIYAEGKNEEMIGRVIKDVRHNIVIQSKFNKKYVNNSREIERSIDESLKALQTDYIDVMLLHGASTEEELNSIAVIEALAMAKESGKILFTGFSSHFNQVETLSAAVKSKLYDIAMLPYNHAGKYYNDPKNNKYHEWDQPALEKEIEKAVSIGMAIVAMKTCSGGPLREKGQTEASYTAALRWILRNKHISAIVPAMGNYREVDEDIKAMG